jgi:hypothetical protein
MQKTLIAMLVITGAGLAQISTSSALRLAGMADAGANIDLRQPTEAAGMGGGGMGGAAVSGGMGGASCRLGKAGWVGTSDAR